MKKTFFQTFFLSGWLLLLAAVMAAPAHAATPVTISGISANGKPYDGGTNTTVNFGGAILNGVSSEDSPNVTLVTSGYTASFSDKNAGTGKTVTVANLSLTGTAAGNYTLTQPVLSATITPRDLTVTAAGANKTYDATANATVTLSDDKVAGDNVLDFYDTASFADKNVGTNKPVSVTDIFIAGTDAGNYTQANTTAATTANIASKVLRVAATGVNKPYDGNDSATVNLVDNHYSGDAVADAYASATFSDQYVGDGITVNVSGISISGTDAGNYALNTTTAHTQASITPRTLTVTATGQGKPYDGTTNATVALSNDHLNGDNITVSFTSASFSDKNKGDVKTVTVYGLVITGPDSDSYTTSPTVTTTASISGRVLNVVATADNKPYDGNTSATVTLSDNRLTGDNLTVVDTGASFGDKNVGNGKTVTVTGISATGPDSGNYTLGSTTATTPANITARDLTVTATGLPKAYDGTVNATVTLSDNHVGSDSLSDSYTSATFSDANTGAGKTVSVVGIQVTGADAANYLLTGTTATTSADISGRILSVAAASPDKTYDGTTNTTVTFSDNRLSGDLITVGYLTAGFGDKRVASGKTVFVNGLNLSGASATNYALASTNITTTASISARDLTVTAAGVPKAYDGTVNANVTLSDNRVTGDLLTDTYASASFADSSAATDKAVSVVGIQITGNDAANYILTGTTASTTADITGRTLSVAATGQDKIYDGNTNAGVTLSDNRLSGDVLTVGFTGASFSDKRVGTGKTVTVRGLSLSGANAVNYTLASTNTSTTANITARSLDVTATGVNKVYDGTTVASVTLGDDRVSGDVLSVSYGSANFADSAVGNTKPVSVAAIYITGTDAGNYSLANTTAGTTANITKAAATLAVLASSENPSGFRDAITFSETLPADATGTVAYLTNGIAFGSGSLAGGSFTSGSISNLLRGTNVITATYSGDANYAAVTNALSQVVTNHPAVTGFFSFSVTNGLSLKLKISDLLSAVVDADGDPVSLVSVGVSTNGMVSYTNSTLILFQNTNRVNDRFSYVVTDGYSYSTGQVSVASILMAFTGQQGSMNITGSVNSMTYHGIPGYTYVVQRSANLLTWVNVATNTAAANGEILVTDHFTDLGGNPPASAFYRLSWIPQ